MTSALCGRDVRVHGSDDILDGSVSQVGFVWVCDARNRSDCDEHSDRSARRPRCDLKMSEQCCWQLCLLC